MGLGLKGELGSGMIHRFAHSNAQRKRQVREACHSGNLLIEQRGRGRYLQSEWTISNHEFHLKRVMKRPQISLVGSHAIG